MPTRTSSPATSAGSGRTSARRRRSEPSTSPSFCRPTARRSAGTLAAGRRPTCSTRRRSPPSTGSSTKSPVDSGTAEGAYVRVGDALWFLAIARVVPQDAMPADVGDADLPRLVIGFGITAELLGDIGRRFMIDTITIGREPVPGSDGDRARGRRRQSAGLGELDGADPGPGGAAGGALAARRADDRREHHRAAGLARDGRLGATARGGARAGTDRGPGQERVPEQRQPRAAHAR